MGLGGMAEWWSYCIACEVQGLILKVKVSLGDVGVCG